jgi:UTP--glucose-1-phosphate uridylyltransferase
MTSVLTQEPIDEAIPATAEVLIFRQRMLPRLTRGLEPWTDREGRASLAPAGNGDVFRALRDSGVGAALLARGVRTVLLSSVDDLAATLDPVALGAHLALDQALTVEVTARRGAPGTLGEGAGPARLGGRVQLVEPGDPAPQPLVATGSLWLDLGRVLAREVNLPWRLLATEVDGDAVLQLEQLTGDVTALEGPGGGPLLPAAWLEVPRRPAEGSRSGDVEPG